MTLPSDRRIREIARTAARSVVDHLGQGHGKPLLVAVSGGADSSALLLMLTDTQSRHGWRIRAAHVDHGIQSEVVRERFRRAAQELAAVAGVPAAPVPVAPQVDRIERHRHHVPGSRFDGVAAAAAGVSLGGLVGLYPAHLEARHRFQLAYRCHQPSNAHSTRPTATSEPAAMNT